MERISVFFPIIPNCLENLLYRPFRPPVARRPSLSMSKYRRLRDRLVADPAHQSDVFLVPPAVNDAQLMLAHDADYVRRAVNGTLTPAEQKRIGFPWSPEMVERSRRSSGATLAAARAAMQEGIAVNWLEAPTMPCAMPARAIAFSMTRRSRSRSCGRRSA